MIADVDARRAAELARIDRAAQQRTAEAAARGRGAVAAAEARHHEESSALAALKARLPAARGYVGSRHADAVAQTGGDRVCGDR